MTRWWFKQSPLTTGKRHQESQLHCPDIVGNADDRAVVSVSALYGANATAYAGKYSLKV